MKLASLIDRANVLPRLDAKTKREAFARILRELEARGSLEGPPEQKAGTEHLLEQLLKRERLGSTNLGNGVGYPHIRCEHFSNFLLSVATIPGGVDYDAGDAEPVRFILLAIVPPEKNSLLLGVVACLSRIIADGELLRELISAEDPEQLWQTLRDSGLEVSEAITAQDIMKHGPVTVPTHMTLAEVAALMHREHVGGC